MNKDHSKPESVNEARPAYRGMTENAILVKPGYKMTEVGVIPKDWDVTRLAKTADIRRGIAKNSNLAISDSISVHYLVPERKPIKSIAINML